MLESFLKDKDVRVKTEVINSLGNFKNEKSWEIISNFVEKDTSSYFLEGACYKNLGKIAKVLGGDFIPHTIKILKETLETKSGWLEIVRSNAILGLVNLSEVEGVADLIIHYTNPGIPTRLRNTAIASLGGVSVNSPSHVTEIILDKLEELSKETFLLTLMSLISALKRIPKSRSIQILNSLKYKSVHGRLQTEVEGAIESIQKEIKLPESIETLQKEIEEMKKDNRTLKSRVEEIEAKKGKGK